WRCMESIVLMVFAARATATRCFLWICLMRGEARSHSSDSRKAVSGSDSEAAMMARCTGPGPLLIKCFHAVVRCRCPTLQSYSRVSQPLFSLQGSRLGIV